MGKINIAELLKHCPKGIELDCTICNGVKFIELDRSPNFPIVVRANNGYEFSLTKYGQVLNIDDAKCVIFPKGKTTWEGFQRPFKMGDKIRHKNNHNVVFTITSIGEDYYACGAKVAFRFADQNNYELVPNKFEITTLKPFDKVLMRSSNAREWVGTFYSHYNNNKFYGCGMCCDQCIPYEGNERLLGKTDDCDEFFKTWE